MKINNRVLSALSGIFATATFWLLTFVVLGLVRNISANWLPNFGGLGDEANAFGSTILLLLGFGGSISVGGEAGFSTFSLPFVILPFLFWGWTRFSVRILKVDRSNAVSAASFVALGAGLSTLAMAVWSSGEQLLAEATVMAQFGWVFPVLVAAGVAYLAVPGSLAKIQHTELALSFRTLSSGYRGSAGFLVFISVLGVYYLALISGTGLIEPAPIWAWLVIFLGIGLFLPTAAIYIAPLALGGAVVASSSIGATVTPFLPEGFEYGWVRWVILAVAWIAVLISSFRAAARINKNYPIRIWKFTVIGLSVGALLPWVSSIRGTTEIAEISWIPKLSGSIAIETIMSIAIFGLAATILGVIATTNASNFGKSIETALSRVISVLPKWSTTVFLTNSSSRGTRRYYATQTIKYTALALSTALVFAIGQPLAFATRPFYDHIDKPKDTLVNAIKTGDAEELNSLFSGDTGFGAVSSTGLGDDSPLDVIPVSLSENDSLEYESGYHISWASNKYYIEIGSTKYTSKEPFLGVIPQYGAGIINKKLPKFELRFNGQRLSQVEIDGKSFAISEMFILPGKASIKAGVDDEQFLQSSTVQVDASRDVSAKVSITIDPAAKSSINESAQSYLSDGNECTNMKFSKSGKPVIGKISGESDLPSIKTTGAGSCDYYDEYFGTTERIQFTFNAVGNYVGGEWLWDYKF